MSARLLRNYINAKLHFAIDDARGLRKRDGDLQHPQKVLEVGGRGLLVRQVLAKSLEDASLALKSWVESLTARAQHLKTQLASATAALEAQKSVVASFAQRLGPLLEGQNCTYRKTGVPFQKHRVKQLFEVHSMNPGQPSNSTTPNRYPPQLP